MPPGGSWRALISFSAESICTQDPAATVYCLVRTVVDPGGTIGGEIVFDSIQHGANSTDFLGWGSHSAQWTDVLTPGAYTIEIQYRVDEGSAAFSMFYRMLSVQLYPV